MRYKLYTTQQAACNIVNALDFFANLIEARLQLDRNEKQEEALAVVTRYCQKLIKIPSAEKQLSQQSVMHLEVDARVPRQNSNTTYT